jgi:predicted PurR-regulated permease PerM
MQDSTTLIITISIGIILFFILRGVNLWYWRINDLIKNQEENNNLLEKIFIQLGGNFNEQEQKNIDLSNQNKEDTVKINKLLNNLKNDEVIIRIKASNQIEKIKKTDWEDIIKIGNQEKFDLLS